MHQQVEVCFTSFQYRKNVSGSGSELGKAYVNFTRNSMEQIRQRVNDELWILTMFEVKWIIFILAALNLL